MSHLSFIVGAAEHSGMFIWTVFNRYTGAELQFDIADTRDAAEADARAYIAALTR